MKIYKIQNGKVVSVEVEKETEKFYWVERSSIFGYCRNITKEHACVSPQEAILEEYNNAIAGVRVFEEKLKDAQDKLGNATLLRKEYNI